MKQKSPLFYLILALSLFTACKSAKVNQAPIANQKHGKTANICDQTIKYHSEKVVMENGGQEMSFNTDITINPSTRVINLSSEPPNQEKVTSNAVIENIDCNLNADLTAGQAIYTGYIKQQDGTTTSSTLKVEAKDGGLTISSASHEEEKNGFIIIISKWEIVKE